MLLACAFMLGAAGAAAQSLPMIDLSAGFHRIQAEVAASNPARMQGLMHRQEMAQHRGMLFVFPESAPHCFWMKNTLIPLSIAFLDDMGRIVNIAEMQPRSENNHCAARPVRYALEMNAGWFARRGIRAGDSIGGIERAPRGY
ncbi:MAG: DUF192 domain-containing protein [Pseudomonadota bacterium]